MASLDLTKATQDYASPVVDKSIGGGSLSIGGRPVPHGLGTHAAFVLRVDLNGSAQRFSTTVGLDDDIRGTAGESTASVTFAVLGDGKPLFSSGPMHVGQSKPVDVDLAGVKRLVLMASPAGASIDYCHTDWGDPEITYAGAKPVAVAIPAETAEILTPPSPATPRIHSAPVFGVRPGHPVLYTVVATGDKPVRFAADGLPAGVMLDPATGRVSGACATPGTYAVRLHATNAKGSADRDLKLVVGDKIALTPMMGWNSWYGYADRVSDAKMRQAADLLVGTGLADHGYSYVCIDDYWQRAPGYEKKDPTLGGVGRDAAGHIVPNPRFPDMRALTDYIHSKGLRAGIYSSPGPYTCGGALGSFGHEADDAATYANWGFDLLKYDWCSYKPSLEYRRKPRIDPTTLPTWGAAAQADQEEQVVPYAIMGDLLHRQPRDLFYLMCQYGMGDSWTWGDSVGGNSARTTGDITDTWGAVTSIGFGQYKRQGLAGPGFWSDPDMLMVGTIGLAHPHPTRLTPNEQYSQVSLWAILPAPLLFGAHLDKLDPFTLGLLTNDEVIAVNQDPLGLQARRIAKTDDTEVWVKDLADGSKAVALFNRGDVERPVTATWADVGATGPQVVRDLWRQRDVGRLSDGYTATLPRHGVAFVRVAKP